VMLEYQLIEKNENTAKRNFFNLCVFGVDSSLIEAYSVLNNFRISPFNHFLINNL